MKVSSLSIWGLSAVALSAGIAQKSKPEKIDFNSANVTLRGHSAHHIELASLARIARFRR